MTQPVILDGEPSSHRLLERWARSLQCFFGLADPETGSAHILEKDAGSTSVTPTEPLLRVVHVEPEITHPTAGFKWRRHPQLLRQAEIEDETDHRGARHDAVRGLYAARAGALDVAVTHFTRAAACPDIDLCDIPGFWQLSRSAMITAVEAYEAVGRIRDASALNARIRTMYRPRALTSVPANVTPMPERPDRISSNS